MRFGGIFGTLGISLHIHSSCVLHQCIFRLAASPAARLISFEAHVFFLTRSLWAHQLSPNLFRLVLPSFVSFLLTREPVSGHGLARRSPYQSLCKARSGAFRRVIFVVKGYHTIALYSHFAPGTIEPSAPFRERKACGEMTGYCEYIHYFAF